MKRSNNEFHHESLQDRESIVELLSSLQKGLAKGVLEFSDEDDCITLKPSGLLSLAIKASSSNELNALNIRITWQSDQTKKIKKVIKLTSD